MNNTDDHNALMSVQCAYCGLWIDSKPGPLNAISHGICEKCFKEHYTEVEHCDMPPEQNSHQ